MTISYLEYLEIPPRSWHEFFFDGHTGRWQGVGIWKEPQAEKFMAGEIEEG